MEDYKVRFINEYKELKERYDKLTTILYKYDNNLLDFDLSCSYELLRNQQRVMFKYLLILEERALIENITLK